MSFINISDERILRAAGEQGTPVPVATLTELDAARDTAALLSMARAVAALAPPGVVDAEQVAQADGVAPRHRPVVRRWVRTLQEAGWLGASGWSRPAPTDDEVARAWDAARAVVPVRGQGRALTDFFAACAEHWAAVVADRVQVQQLLFDDPVVAEEIYQTNPASRCTNAVAAAAVAGHCRRLSEQGRRARVLEVGAGTGATTDGVLDALRDLDVDYSFTDVGEWFGVQALDRYAGRAGFGVGVLDLEELDPAVAPQDEVDVVLAGNVLHNATRPGRTLRALAALTRPGGLLVVVETGTEHLPLLISMRLLMSPAGGRGGPQDERADEDRIFLGLERWSELVATSGWGPPVAVPGHGSGHWLERYDQHTLVAVREDRP